MLYGYLVDHSQQYKAGYVIGKIKNKGGESRQNIEDCHGNISGNPDIEHWAADGDAKTAES